MKSKRNHDISAFVANYPLHKERDDTVTDGLPFWQEYKPADNQDDTPSQYASWEGEATSGGEDTGLPDDATPENQDEQGGLDGVDGFVESDVSSDDGDAEIMGDGSDDEYSATDGDGVETGSEAGLEDGNSTEAESVAVEMVLAGEDSGQHDSEQEKSPAEKPEDTENNIRPGEPMPPAVAEGGDGPDISTNEDKQGRDPQDDAGKEAPLPSTEDDNQQRDVPRDDDRSDDDHQDDDHQDDDGHRDDDDHRDDDGHPDDGGHHDDDESNHPTRPGQGGADSYTVIVDDNGNTVYTWGYREDDYSYQITETYNPDGDLLSTAWSDNLGAQSRTTITVDEHHNTVYETRSTAGEGENAYWAQKVATYSQDGELISSAWSNSEGDHGSVIHDADGNTVRSTFQTSYDYTYQSTEIRNPEGELVSSSWSNSRGESGSTTVSLDESGNTVRSSSVTTHDYCWNHVMNQPVQGSSIDSTYTRDTVEIYSPNGELISSSWATNQGDHGSTTVSHDADGNTVCSSSQGWGDQTAYQSVEIHDRNGELVSSSWSSNWGGHGSTTVSHDADGNEVRSTISGRGDQITYQSVEIHDREGELVSSSWTDSRGGHGSITVSHDAEGNTVRSSSLGWGDQITYQSVEIHDREGELVSSSWTDSRGGHGSITVSHDAEGNTVRSSSHGWGDQVNYQSIEIHDRNGELVSSSWSSSWGGHGSTTVSHETDGNTVRSTSLACGDYTYQSIEIHNRDGELVGSNWFDSHGSHGSTTVSHDADGNAIHSTSSVWGRYTSERMETYNPAGELVSSSWSDSNGDHGNTSVTVDDYGNTVHAYSSTWWGRTNQHTETYDAHGDLMGTTWSESYFDSHGSTMIQRDAEGNRVVISNSTYGEYTYHSTAVYNHDGNLISYTSSDSHGNHSDGFDFDLLGNYISIYPIRSDIFWCGLTNASTNDGILADDSVMPSTTIMAQESSQSSQYAAYSAFDAYAGDAGMAGGMDMAHVSLAAISSDYGF